MDALKRSLANEKAGRPRRGQGNGQGNRQGQGKKPRKAAAGQREMLLPISGSGKRAAKEDGQGSAEEGREAGAHVRPHEEGRLIARARSPLADQRAMPWSTPFDEPIALRGGRTLTTLQQAADYIMRLPEAEQQRSALANRDRDSDQCGRDRRRLADVRADRE